MPSPLNDRLNALLEFLKDWEQLLQTSVSNVTDYKAGLEAWQHEVQGLPGVRLDESNDAGQAAWLEIERLDRIKPVPPPDSLIQWVQRWESYTSVPTLRERDEAEVHIGTPPPTAQELQALFDQYIEQVWQPWAEKERPRRLTIQLYDKLFRIHQEQENDAQESPVHVVWGSGIACWRYQREGSFTTIRHPLITQGVDVEVDPTTFAIRLTPTERTAQFEAAAFQDLRVAGFQPVAEQAQRDLEDLPVSFSPFEVEGVAPILRKAVSVLDPHGRFVTNATPSDLRPGQELLVTGGWMIFARRRNTSYLRQDLDKLQESVTHAQEPGDVGSLFVAEPEGATATAPEIHYRGLSTPGINHDDVQELYFPKEFNAEQVEIVKRLEQQEGVVVQGPPGTGKTHTIANIVCHFLALGKRVLVTSKGEAALRVLREQLPVGIQDLTVSLQANDRAGRTQLDASVKKINERVTNLKPRQVQAEIDALEAQVHRLHGDLATIDGQLKNWAHKNLHPVPESLGGGSTEALAREVVSNENRFSWFTDRLSFGSESEPAITEEEMVRLREARRGVARSLSYASTILPHLEEFPSADEVGRMHSLLQQADQVRALQSRSRFGGLPLEDANMAASAERLLAQIRAHLELISTTTEPWQKRLRQEFHNAALNGETVSRLQSLDLFVAQVAAVLKSSDDFAATAVTLPDDALDNDALRLAMQRGSEGRRPIPLFAILSSKLKRSLASVLIDGTPPKNAAAWQRAVGWLNILLEARRLCASWGKLRIGFDAPDVPMDAVMAIERLRLLVSRVQDARALGWQHDSTLADRVVAVFTHIEAHDVVPECDCLEELREALELHLKKRRLHQATTLARDLPKRLADMEEDLFSRMRAWFRNIFGQIRYTTTQAEEDWVGFLDELRSLHRLQPHFEVIRELSRRIVCLGAPNWASSLQSTPPDDEVDDLLPNDWNDAWQWSRKNAYLDSIEGRDSIRKLTSSRLRAENDLGRAYESLVQQRSWLRLVERLKLNKAIPQALETYARALNSMTQTGRGVRDGLLRRTAQGAMPTASQGVPCWIMPHWRVSETLPAKLGDFDLVIVDEASQSDAWALPSLLRGKKLLIVGDDNQVGPPPNFIPHQQLMPMLAKLERAGIPPAVRTFVSPQNSIYELASILFAGQVIRLREHFRCSQPIIEFSNNLCYDGEIRCLRVPSAEERLLPTLVDVWVEGGFRHRTKKINEAEAGFIVEEIGKLLRNPQFVQPLLKPHKPDRHRTIGVVCLLGNEQGKLLYERIQETVGEEVMLRHDIRCGDARTFQGREADVIFISTVDDSKSCQSGYPTRNKKEDVRRVNVAASRARDRLYVVHSFSRSHLTEADLRARLLDHIKSPLRQPTAHIAARERCESQFETAMFDALAKRGYSLETQVETNGRRIDIVVQGLHGRRLAVECDGDRYHGPDQWLEDIGRQRELERAGWRFWRCFASSFVRDSNGCLAELEEILQAMGITPLAGSEASESSEISAFWHVRAQTSDEGETQSPESEESTTGFDGVEGDLESAKKDSRTTKQQATTQQPGTAIPPATPRAIKPRPMPTDITELELFRHAQQPVQPSVHAEAPPRVCIGDRVTFRYLDDGEENVVTITDGPSNPDLDIVNDETAVARALLGVVRGSQIDMKLPVGTRKAQVVQVESVD